MLTIREATLSDIQVLQCLYHEHLTHVPPTEPPDPKAWHDTLSTILKTPGYHLYLGEVAGQPVASVTLIIVPNLTHGVKPYAWIENVVTHAAHRQKGYASALMKHASDEAQAQGCYKIMLMTGSKKESTLRFYEKSGFDRTSKTGLLKRLP